MSAENTPNTGAGERMLRLGRNINALGAAAIAGVALIIPGPNVVLAGWAGLNAAQAGGFEVWRQHQAKRAKGRRTRG